MTSGASTSFEGSVKVTWDDPEIVKATEGTPVDIVKLWDQHASKIKALEPHVVKLILLTGKKTRSVLKARAAQSKASQVSIGGLTLNFSKDLGPMELNFQRLAALVAYWNSQKTKDWIIPAMGSCIPPTGDKGFERFQAMMAPGYAFLGKGLFAESGNTLPFNNKKGDKGRYLAGAVMLDWVQSVKVSGDRAMTLKKFYRDKGWEEVLGTVKQLVCNNNCEGGMKLDLEGEEIYTFRGLLERECQIMAGAAIRERVKVATATWT